MAGPWFAVLENGSDWERLDTLWISDGNDHERARLEIRVRLDEVMP